MSCGDNLVEIEEARPGWLESNDNHRYRITAGTVNPAVTSARHGVPWLYATFGMPEYDRDKPVLSDGRKQRAQPIVAALNRGAIDPEECIALLNTHAWW